MKNKILLVGLFCCSLVSTEAQVLLDKNAGKNSFPIVSPAANVQSPNQKIPDRKTKCVIKTHINIKQNVIFGAKLKPV